MSPNELIAAVRLQPFEPFRVVLSDGASYDIRHPDNIIVGLRTSVIAVPLPSRPDYAAHTVKVDNLHITQMVPLPTAV